MSTGSVGRGFRNNGGLNNTMESAHSGGGGGAGASMTHSLSTPSGVNGTGTPQHNSGKKLAVRVTLLDESQPIFQVQVSSGGLITFIFYC